ncbi:MAG: hypothetical protein ACYDG6_04855 [Thermincolia bacterium]
MFFLFSFLHGKMTFAGFEGFVSLLKMLGVGLVVNALGIDVLQRETFGYKLEDSLDRAYGAGFILWLMILVLSGEKTLAKLWLYGLQTAWLGIIIGLKVSAHHQKKFYRLLVVGLLMFIVISGIIT